MQLGPGVISAPPALVPRAASGRAEDGGDDGAVVAAGEDDYVLGIEQSQCGGLLVDGVGGD